MWPVFFQSTSNYHARRFGVRAAMPGFIAKKLCPQLTIVPPNFDIYRAVSREVSLMSHSLLIYSFSLISCQLQSQVHMPSHITIWLQFNPSVWPPSTSSACILNTELHIVSRIHPHISQFFAFPHVFFFCLKNSVSPENFELP